MGHLSHIKRRPRFRREVDIRFGLGPGAVCADETRTFAGRWHSATCRQIERTTAFALGAGTLCADETRTHRGIWSGPLCREADISTDYGLTPAALCADESYAFRASWKQAVCNQVEKATGFALGNGHVLCADDQVIEVIDVRRFHGIWTTPRCSEEEQAEALPILAYSRHWGSSVDVDSKQLTVEMVTMNEVVEGFYFYYDYFLNSETSSGFVYSQWVAAGPAGRKITFSRISMGQTGTAQSDSYRAMAAVPRPHYVLDANWPKKMKVWFRMGIHPGGVGEPIAEY